MKSLVSVCIPAYRQPELLVRAVESVLSQKGCDFEIVVTDDTEDASVETAIRPYRVAANFRYFRNPQRLGATSNWNTSIRQAAGSIVKVLHHDDWLNTDTSLLRTTEPILLGTVPVVFCACRAMSITGVELFVHRATPEQLAELERRPGCLALGNFIGAPSVAAFERTLGVDFDPGYTWLADVEFYIRLLEATGLRFKYIDEPLVNITVDSPLQLSRECEANRMRSALENVKLFSARKIAGFGRQSIANHFAQIGRRLEMREVFGTMRYACGTGNYSIALMLARGCLERFVPR